jgi:hypothetical protein
MPTTDNSMSTRTRLIKGRVLASFALSGPIKPQLDQSNETYEIIQQGEKPYVIQPPIGGTTVDSCVCSSGGSCVPPTAGAVTLTDLGPISDPTYDTLFSYTVDQTNGTSFQWFIIFRDTTTQLSDGGNVSGSQTPTLVVKTKTIGCPPIIQPRYFYCVVSNNCGSAVSENALVQGC